MTVFRWALSIFSILNVAFWAMLAWAWALQPAWAARLPLQLGSRHPGNAPAPTWARLAAAIAGFWSVAAVLYLILAVSNRLAFIALFVLAAVFLILGIGAAARVYGVLQLPKQPAMDHRRQQAH